MQIYLSRPDITNKEVDAVCSILRSPNLSLGPPDMGDTIVIVSLRMLNSTPIPSKLP